MNTKGQGALEYLLIIGGAVLVAGIVIALIMSAASPVQANTNQQILNSLCAGPATAQTCWEKDPDGSGTACRLGTTAETGDCVLDSKNVCVGRSPRYTTNCFP